MVLLSYAIPGVEEGEAMSTGTLTQAIDILIGGVGKVGKTTFIRTISQYTDNAHSDGWFTGQVQIDEGLDAHFIEPPATPYFDFHWQRDLIADADVHGMIVVCDSTRPDNFGEMIAILETIRAFHPDMPCVLAANKQDQTQAWSAEDIRVALGIPDSIPVMPCIATDLNSVGNVVVRVLEEIWRA
ncbi:MAG: hypothetical protein SF029_22450 [bacterium]|nr:hypothetical protein [bacterium]